MSTHPSPDSKAPPTVDALREIHWRISRGHVDADSAMLDLYQDRGNPDLLARYCAALARQTSSERRRTLQSEYRLFNPPVSTPRVLRVLRVVWALTLVLAICLAVAGVTQRYTLPAFFVVSCSSLALLALIHLLSWVRQEPIRLHAWSRLTIYADERPGSYAFWRTTGVLLCSLGAWTFGTAALDVMRLAT